MADIPPKQQVNGSETIRMGQTEGLPRIEENGGMGDGSPYGDSAYHGAALARRRPDAEDQAFAILKAFQDYMERERNRAQHRSTTLIMAFAALLAITVAGFAAIWFTTMRGMQGTQSDLLKAALAAREATAAPQVDIASAVASAVEKANAGQSAAIAAAVAQAEKAAADRDAAANAAEAERAAAAKAFDERLAEERRKAAEAASAKEAALAKSIADLNAAIEGVRKDNERLRRDNEALRAAKAAPKAAPRTAQNPPAPQPAAASPSGPSDQSAADIPLRARVETIAPKITIKRPAPPKGYAAKSIVLPVGEKGESQVNWRLLIPTEAPAQ